MEYNNKRVLVAYYSRKGMNYFGGKIVDLAVGNTEIAAKTAASFLNADLFEIEAVKPYPADYNECTVVAKDELKQNARPALVKDVNTDGYDVIVLGYPSWRGTMPMPIWTFLEAHDFSGKTILPFCTNEGSGLGASVRDIAKLVKGAEILGGLSIRGSAVKTADSEIIGWLKNS